MSAKPNIITLDIETTGLDAYRDEILMVGIYDGETYTCCRTKEELASRFAHLSDSTILGHNIMFDLRFLLVKGWLDKIPDIHDTQLMAHVWTTKVPKAYREWYEVERREKNKALRAQGGLHSHREVKGGLSLKILAPYFLRVPAFWETPGNHDNEEYNRKDCEYTYKLYNYIWERMTDQEREFYQRRMLPWAKMCLEMQLTGIEIDLPKIDEMEKKLQAKAAILKDELDAQWADAHKTYRQMQIGELNARYTDMAHRANIKSKDPVRVSARYNQLLLDAVEKIEPFNYASPTQMTWLLKDYLGLDITSLDDEDEETTGKAVLNKLANEGRDDVAKFLEWRKTNKILTSFLPKYKELQVNGVLHPTFNITGTRTGRTSCSNPNLQQVPGDLYSLFRPRPGYRFIIYDLSGIEAALIALYSGDQTLYDILDKGESIHDHNTKALFNLPCPVSSVAGNYVKQRKTVKNIGFACFYGAGWRRISQVFAAGGFPISDTESKNKLRALKATYPGAFRFHDEITEVFEIGQTVENLFGRPIKIQPDENAYMQGFNTLIQNSASDLFLRGLEKAKAEWAKSRLSARPLLIIHDCAVVEAKIADCVQADKILVDSMTGFKLESDHGLIQLRVEGGISDVWSK